MAEKKTTKKAPQYGAEQITVLEGLEAVRKRPGMYIGSTGPDGLHHMLVEIFDNGRDEAMGGFADEVEVVLLPDGAVRISDNGRGIPVDVHKKTKVSALETVMTTLHAGGKFDSESYKIAGGLHGVGASVVNALSERAYVIVHRDGGVYRQDYIRGKKTAPVKKIGSSRRRGTVVVFKPDVEIFSALEFDRQRIINHLREQAYLTKKLRIRVIDAREVELNGAQKKMDGVFFFKELGIEAPSHSFYFEGGLLSLINFYNLSEKTINRTIFYVDKEHEGVFVEIGLQYIDDIASREASFANNTSTPEGGMHMTGFRTVLTRSLNAYAKKSASQKDGDAFTAEDVREGLVAVISVKMQNAQFEGQTKAKLGSTEARTAVETVFGDAFGAYLEEHPEDARVIINKIMLAMRARKAAKAAKETVLRKGALEGMTLPGKLADCQTRSAAEAELFIVEGDSAGGCFSGDTQVALVDGRALSFEDIVKEDAHGKQNFCYTVDAKKNIAVAPILHPRITKKSAEVIKINLDTGETITCTPDHRFMLRDGSYKQAQELDPRDLLRMKNDAVPDSRIAKIEMVSEKIDVYDIEVPGTHNFALASGVFVHNSSKMGRDRRTQAILPLKGKILNVEKARLDKMLSSEEIKALIIALGTAIGDTFELDKLRYHKVIIATDADVDGAHIRTLLLTLFYRYFRPLIDAGNIYIAQPPLYKIKKGKEVHYAYSDAQKEKITGSDVSGYSIQRYKGLGEMNPEELWETTMNPNTRVLKQITVLDAEAADKTFNVLMGSEVAPRKLFIQTNARLATVDA